jgi:hypothetical protein
MATEMKCRVRVLFALLCALSSASPSQAEPFFPITPCSLDSNGESPARFAKLDHTPRALTSTASTPTNGTAPQNLTRPKIIIPLGCNRPILYRGELYSIDSPQAQDAQTLKAITKDSPEAQALIDQYQNNRIKSRISAYTGTVGIFIAIFSTGLGRWLHPRDPKLLQTAALLTGAAITVEGFSYSINLLRSNEAVLTKAVNAHNQNKPNDPVELQFTTGWSF